MKNNLLNENNSENDDALNRTKFWGTSGVGCIFLAKDTHRLLIAHRSHRVNEPDTWGCWGGAIDANETPEHAIHREIEEETGYIENLKLIPLIVFKKDSFKYYNYLAVVEHEFKPHLQWETQNYEWVSYGQWPTPLHFGLKYLIAHSGDKIQQLIRSPENLTESQIYKNYYKFSNSCL